MGSSRNTPLVCQYCGTGITNDPYIENGAGFCACESCDFQDTYLDGITSQIDAFVTAVDSREHEKGNHSLRATQFAIVIGHAYGIRARDLMDLCCGSLLHDIGKI